MKVKLSIPNDLSEIKLSQYQKFIKTTKDSEDDSFIARQMVAIFCNVPDDIVGKISKKGFDDIVGVLSKMFEQKPKLKPIVKHNGIEYGFIPKIDDITVNEQADIDSQIHDWSKMDSVMGVMYRPIEYKRKNEYIIKDYEPNKLDLPLDVVFGAIGFFLNLWNDLLTSTLNYIKVEVQTNKQLISVKNGDGIKTSISLLEETFSDLKQLASLGYMKRYCS